MSNNEPNIFCEASHPQKMVKNWGWVSFSPTKTVIMDRLLRIVEKGWIREHQSVLLWLLPVGGRGR